MSTVWLVLGAVVCPLGMLAMGGAAWVAAKLRRREPEENGTPIATEVTGTGRATSIVARR